MRATLCWQFFCVGLCTLLCGCTFRMTDPIYASRELRPDAPEDEDRSLVIGTIEADVFGESIVDSVTFKNVLPGARKPYRTVSRSKPFRAFRNRCLKNGHFMLQLPPGEYALDSITTAGWLTPLGNDVPWYLSKDKGADFRVLVTRPRVIDVGTFRIVHDPRERDATISQVETADSERQDLFAEALAGTPWEDLYMP